MQQDLVSHVRPLARMRLSRPDAMEHAPETTTSISLPLALCEQATALGIDIAQTCERALGEAIHAELGRRWAAQLERRCRRDVLQSASGKRGSLPPRAIVKSPCTGEWRSFDFVKGRLPDEIDA
ncbi:type II toxin-antitoxin system CcdA family antitoxin [Paraburkholderia youngii]|uniref:type II toxin-antitoxin system CcdA family antitoxin n=1 Tax=Paraburkholderia youngii TaxID=2782701 RepID=UPI003D1CB094